VRKSGITCLLRRSDGLSTVPDLSVIGIEAILNDGDIADVRVTFSDGGVDAESVDFNLYFSVSPISGGTAMYLVHEDTLNLGATQFFAVNIENAGSPNAVPQGDYYIEAVIDPDDEIEEDDETNNGYITAGSYSYGSEEIFFTGEGFEIELDADMPMVPFDASHPIHIIVMDGDEAGGANYIDGGVVRAAEPGLYFIQLSDIAVQDTNDSGYRVTLLFDDGDDWQQGMELGTEDFTAMYDTSYPGNVVFPPGGGSPVVVGTKHFYGPSCPMGINMNLMTMRPPQHLSFPIRRPSTTTSTHRWIMIGSNSPSRNSKTSP
jgi:CARDB protein